MARDDLGNVEARTSAGSGPVVVVRKARPGDETAIQDLFAATFAGPRSMDGWRWRYLRCPAPSLVLLIEREGEVVGHAAWNRFDAYLDGQDIPITSGGDWMYRPDVRGMGLSKHLLPAMFEMYAAVGASVEFPSPEAFVAIERRGYDVHDLGQVPQWVRWHTGRAVRVSNRRVPAPVAWALTRIGALRGRIGARTRIGRRSVTREWASSTELDDLADRLRTSARCLRARHAAYIAWRWREQPERAWWMLTARAADRTLRGWVVAGVDPEGVGRIVDLLVDDPATMTQLIDAAARALRDEGAELVTCELLDARPWTRSAMRRAGFVARGTGPIAVCTWVAEGHDEWGDVGSWYLTRGDTDFA